MKLKITLIWTSVFIMIVSMTNFLDAMGDNMKITKEKAIEIARKEAIRLGYDIKSMDIWITKFDTPWNDYLPKDSKSEYVIERQNKLKGKEYWAVSYFPKQTGSIILGGNICIFIDSNNGEVLAIYKGK